MKVVKVLILAVIVGLVATSAYADSASDPQIKLGPSGSSTHTTDGATAADPIFVTDGSHTDWFLDNPLIATNGVLYVEVIPALGEDPNFFNTLTWTCDPVAPVATGCAFVAAQGLYSNAVAQGFSYITGCTSFDSGSLACPAVEVAFTGPFTVGEDVGIGVPEPSVLLLLLVGLPLVLFFRPKKALLESAA